MKHRLERVNEIIKRELSEIALRDLNFEAKLVTFQQVDVTPDLKNAHVFVGVIGTEAERRNAIALLNGNRAELQRELSRRVVLKYTPHLHFKLDDSIERGGRVLGILAELDLPEEPADEPGSLEDI